MISSASSYLIDQQDLIWLSHLFLLDMHFHIKMLPLGVPPSSLVSLS